LGLVDEVRGKKICIDTAPIIYFIEQHPKYHDIISPVLTAIDSWKIVAITSTITIRTPDEIQIAVGILYGATHFLTNDPNLEKISEIKVLVLDDYLSG
jgi:predicted nucleic acid-binding protein